MLLIDSGMPLNETVVRLVNPNPLMVTLCGELAESVTT